MSKGMKPTVVARSGPLFVLFQVVAGSAFVTQALCLVLYAPLPIRLTLGGACLAVALGAGRTGLYYDSRLKAFRLTVSWLTVWTVPLAQVERVDVANVRIPGRRVLSVSVPSVAIVTGSQRRNIPVDVFGAMFSVDPAEGASSLAMRLQRILDETPAG